MPELPEIESLRRYLVAERVAGRVVSGVDAGWPGAGGASDAVADLGGLPGRRIESVERHGKQMVVALDRGVLGLHMGMTGRLVVMKPDAEPLRYARYTFHLDDGRRIELDDARRWAAVRLAGSAGDLIGNLGPDALDPRFTAARFAARIGCRRAAIKPLLMDQSVLAGVGNIYADESLHRAGISPTRRAHRISRARLERLHGAVVETLESAVRFIAGHPGADGSPFVVDAYDDRMRLSRRIRAPCPSCGIPIRSRRLGGRTAYYCPGCQR